VWQSVELCLEISHSILYRHTVLLFGIQGVGFKPGGDMRAPYIEVIFYTLLFLAICIYCS